MAGIDSDLIRGHIDTIILKSLYHGDKYGLEIIQEIEEKSNGSYELKQPTLYSCLKRLESQGLISSYWEDSEIGGKRHYYKLTDQGKETYKNNQEEWLKSREIIDNLIYNTTVDYAPIYDNDAEKDVNQANQSIKETSIIDKQEAEETQETTAAPVINQDDYMADNDQEDEFASFDQVESTAFGNFFADNSEVADSEEIEEETTTPVQTPTMFEEPDEEPVNLDIDDPEIEEPSEIIVDQNVDEVEESENYHLVEEDESNIDNEEKSDPEPEAVFGEYSLLDNSFETSTSDDDEIYNPEPELLEEEYTDVSETDKEDRSEIIEEDDEEPVTATPTYINFDSNNYDEVDITNQDFEQQEEPLLNLEKEQEKIAIEPEVEESIDESQPGQVFPHASQEEIESLYRTTENYQNLQAGYTDETYKQMLNELESYGSSQTISETKTNHKKALTFSELTDSFEKDGIVIRRYEKQVKESNDSKIYIKTNQIHLVKNWITFGISAVALLVLFAIMSGFKDGYTYNFAFWQFAVAIGVAILIPLYSTIKYAINPYKKVVAKYAPRLSILLGVLITIQLILIIYCVNLQLGFYSFAQENYNHLLWILPLVLSFIPVIQSLVYLPLYNSKKYHI